MRTTLSLDDDVVAALARLQARERRSFKALVNDVLRCGLRQIAAPPPRAKPYRTPAVDLGRCLLSNIDDVADVLAVAEGEAFR